MDLLRRHKRIHASQKPVLVCPREDCQAYFSTTFNLQHHIRKVHLNLLKYKCPFPECPRMFAMRVSQRSIPDSRFSGAFLFAIAWRCSGLSNRRAWADICFTMTQMQAFRRFESRHKQLFVSLYLYIKPWNQACWSGGWLHACCLCPHGSFAETSPAKEVLAEAAGRAPPSPGGGRPAAPLRPAHASVPTHQGGDQPVGSLQRAEDPSLRGPGGRPTEPVCSEKASTGEAGRLKGFTLCGEKKWFNLKGI